MKMKVFTMMVMMLLCLGSMAIAQVAIPLAVDASAPHGKVPTMNGGDTGEQLRRAATCRVRVIVSQVGNMVTMKNGSGTVFNKRTVAEDRAVGLIATCAHIFPAGWTLEQCKKLPIDAMFFGDEERRSATLLAIDWANDTSIWAVYVRPDQPVIPLATRFVKRTDSVVVCGWAIDGHFRARPAVVNGYVSAGWNGIGKKVIPASRCRTRYRTAGQNQVYVTKAIAYKGDSGGGIITPNNELAGVLWGGGHDVTYGTYAGTIQELLESDLPETYSWGCVRWRPRLFPMLGNRGANSGAPPGCNPNVSVDAPGVSVTVDGPPAPDLVLPTGEPVTPGLGEPAATAPGVDPAVVAASHEEVLEELGEIRGELAAIKATQAQHTTALETLATGQATVIQNQQTLAQGVQVLQGEHAAMTGSLDDAKRQLEQLAAGGAEAEVTLNVESQKYISPSYVDVSVLWALQQKTGIDHIVLVADTASGGWPRLKSEFAEAQKKFPAIMLFDVASRGVRFKELPQLVVYPVNPEQQPVIIKGTDSVSKQLQAIVREEPGGIIDR